MENQNLGTRRPSENRLSHRRIREDGLAQQLEAAAIGYRRSDNKITAVEDSAAVAAVCERFAHTAWPLVLERQAALVNPLLPDIARAGFPGYWWVIDQCEYASNVLFTDRETIRGDLVTAAITTLGATEVMHFLGRKPHPAFAGEVTIDSRRRREGCRVRFRLKPSSSTITPTCSGSTSTIRASSRCSGRLPTTRSRGGVRWAAPISGAPPRLPPTVVCWRRWPGCR
jgi:hypothetical protein